MNTVAQPLKSKVETTAGIRDDVAPLLDRMVAGERGLLVAEDPFFYATTSGTTGRRKLLPVTRP